MLELAPNIVPQYNQVLEKEEYEAFSKFMSMLASLLAVFSLSFTTGVFDNARYEDVITKTDGLFKMRDELVPYFKYSLPQDLIASAIPQAFFIPLTIINYSKKFLKYFGGYLAPHIHLASFFTPVGTYFAIFSAAILGRIAAMPLCLSRSRALWLTSFVDS